MMLYAFDTTGNQLISQVTVSVGQGVTVNHALICPTGGFPSLRHNELSDFTAKLLVRYAQTLPLNPCCNLYQVNVLLMQLQTWKMEHVLMFLHKAFRVIDIREPFLMSGFFILMPSPTTTSS